MCSSEVGFLLPNKKRGELVYLIFFFFVGFWHNNVIPFIYGFNMNVKLLPPIFNTINVNVYSENIALIDSNCFLIISQCLRTRTRL